MQPRNTNTKQQSYETKRGPGTGQAYPSGSQRPASGQSGPQQPSRPAGQQPPANPPAQGSLEDNTGYAPELRAVRSENLYRRDKRFWESVSGTQETMPSGARQDSYFKHQAQYRRKPKPKPQPGPKGRSGSHVVTLVVCLALLVVGVVILFASPLFEVKGVRVVGNSRVSSEEIIARAGVKKGTNRFLVDSASVAKRVEGNSNLICELVHFPDLNTLEIRVKEREVVTIIDYNGLLYYSDNRGMILQEFANRELIPASGKILVVGLDVRRCDPGRIVTLGDEAQLNVYTEILVELKVMSALDEIIELDMSSMDSIFLETRDGFTVRLGNGLDIHQKLRSMLLTLEKLREGGYPPGDVDVSAPVTPSYIPDAEA